MTQGGHVVNRPDNRADATGSLPAMTGIDDVAVRLETAFNAHDSAALASLYGDTATLMPPNEPMVSGRPAIQAWFERVLPRVGRVRVVPSESIDMGDRAVQVGALTTSPSGQEGGDDTRTGKYVLLLTKRRGQWTIDYDIWNLDQPAG
jgi:ketosteroid isomerase-like protein